jgi:hypothetical protein
LKPSVIGLLLFLAAPAFAIGENDDYGAVPGMIRTGGLLLFYETTGPMSFVAMTPRDVPVNARPIGEVKGVTCQRGLSVPIAANINAMSVSGGYGDGGFARALSKMKKEHPDLVGIYDVKTDMSVFSILGFYRSLCIEVTARGFAAAAVATPDTQGR